MTRYLDRGLVAIIALGLTALLSGGARPPMAWGEDTLNVANFGSNTVTTYPRTSSGDIAPRSTLAGANTHLNGPGGLAWDCRNVEFFISNVGDSSITAHSFFGEKLRVLMGPATALDHPFGIALDMVHGELFVANAGSITVYNRAVKDNSAPLRVLAGPATGLNRPTGVAVDIFNDELVVSNNGNDSVTVYSRTASGNTAPVRTLSGPATGLNSAFGVAVDVRNGELVVSNFDSVTAYSRTASGNTTPLRTLSGPATGLARAAGLLVSAWDNELLVPNLNGNSVTVYSRTASGDTAPVRTLAGPATGISGPSSIAFCTEGLLFTVTNTSSSVSVAGSLPWAVDQANLHPGRDQIDFHIPGPGVHTITVNAPLVLNEDIVVNGNSQRGHPFVGTPGPPQIYVVGTAGVTSLFVLQNDSPQSVIQNLGLYGYTSDALTILSPSTGNWILYNYMGFYDDGVSPVLLNRALYPNTRGIGLRSSFNVILGNTFSGVDNGVVIGEDPTQPWSGTVYKTNSIRGNRIGTNPAGDSAAGFGNTSDGLLLGGGGRENWLGPGNVLSGNGGFGAELLHPSVIGNILFGNMIGLNAAGTAAIPNGRLGVLLANGASGNAIGGPFGGNVISANPFGGVSLGAVVSPPFTGAANGNWVQRNIIGLNISQTGVPGSQQVGVSLSNGSTLNDIEGNVLAGHVFHGAQLYDVVTNSVSNNWIGMSSSGVAQANGGFGVYFHNASNNFATGNAFGVNTLGPFGADGTSCCNATN